MGMLLGKPEAENWWSERVEGDVAVGVDVHLGVGRAEQEKLEAQVDGTQRAVVVARHCGVGGLVEGLEAVGQGFAGGLNAAVGRSRVGRCADAGANQLKLAGVVARVFGGRVGHLRPLLSQRGPAGQTG
jgi:hypothetical protein